MPSGQILTIQQGAQSQSVVRQAVPSPVNTVRPQSGVRVSVPQNVPAVRTTAAAVSTAQPAAAAQGKLEKNNFVVNE